MPPLQCRQQSRDAESFGPRCITRCITQWISLWITLWIERWNLGGMRSAPLVVTDDPEPQEDGELSPVSRETFTGSALCGIFLPKGRKTTEFGHFRGQSDLSQSHNQHPSQSPQFVTPATLLSGWVEDVDMSRITEPGPHRQVWISLWISSVENCEWGWGQNRNRIAMGP